MGRPRNDNRQGLPRRVYLRHGSFYYVHPTTGKWENLGRDLTLARKRADHYNDPTGLFGTMAWHLDQFILDCEKRVKAKDLAERTVNDYRDALLPLKAFFGAMLPSDIKPHHVSEYLDIGAKANRATRANRERACLSSCMSWMLRNGEGGITVNPCMRASGVVRNAESQRERYVTHDEYQAVFKAAPFQVRLMMELTYRTLQRPESDIILWTHGVIRTKDGGRVLSFRQHKTQRMVDIAIPDELDAMIRKSVGDVPRIHQTLIHTRTGEPYTYSGLSAMLKRAQIKAKVASFGFRDLKGKGATDMWLAGVPIELIQLLCGHATKSTTEKYIKARWRETAQPNSTKIAF